jgi:hypothetical protein
MSESDSLAGDWNPIEHTAAENDSYLSMLIRKLELERARIQEKEKEQTR